MKHAWMQLMVWPLVWLLANTFSTASATETNRFQGEVTEVKEGDLIVVSTSQGFEEVRLYGVDAPEPKQPYGEEAIEFISAQILGQKVTVEVKKKRDGRERRRVGWVFSVNGSNVNEMLVKKGLAWWASPKAPNESILAELEAVAHQSKIGLWRDDRPLAPWIFRKGVIDQKLKTKDMWTDCRPPTRSCPALFAPTKCTLKLEREATTLHASATNGCMVDQLLAYQACRQGGRLKGGVHAFSELPSSEEAGRVVREGKVLAQGKRNWSRKRIRIECEPSQAGELQRTLQSQQNELQGVAAKLNRQIVELEAKASSCEKVQDCEVVLLPECEKRCQSDCGQVVGKVPTSLNKSDARRELMKKLESRELMRCIALGEKCSEKCKKTPAQPVDSSKWQARCIEFNCILEPAR